MRSIITFIKYTKSQKCGQTNNLKALARKPWLILAMCLGHLVYILSNLLAIYVNDKVD